MYTTDSLNLKFRTTVVHAWPTLWAPVICMKTRWAGVPINFYPSLFFIWYNTCRVHRIVRSTFDFSSKPYWLDGLWLTEMNSKQMGTHHMTIIWLHCPLTWACQIDSEFMPVVTTFGSSENVSPVVQLDVTLTVAQIRRLSINCPWQSSWAIFRRNSMLKLGNLLGKRATSKEREMRVSRFQ